MTDQQVESAIAALRRLPYRDYLRTSHWFRVREWALVRAQRACALCPATRELQVHHRSYARLGCEQPEDLIVLCRNCHQRHHGILPKEPTETPLLVITADFKRRPPCRLIVPTQTKQFQAARVHRFLNS
jgi:5-methylcytosine-specific restriction endonuclease McrA